MNFILQVLVSTTIIFMATITLQESRPRVNAAKDMLENIARRPLVGKLPGK
jgi:hypothetical protein